MASYILAGHTYSYTLIKILPHLSLSLKVDGFGMLFALVASTLWIVTSIYSIGYMRGLKEHAQTRYFCCFAVALSATIGVAFSANLFTMYVFYEMLSLSTYPLVTHHQDREARSAGRKYLTYLLGTSIGFALPAMIITYVTAGSLDFTAAGVFASDTSRTLLLVSAAALHVRFLKGRPDAVSLLAARRHGGADPGQRPPARGGGGQGRGFCHPADHHRHLRYSIFFPLSTSTP